MEINDLSILFDEIKMKPDVKMHYFWDGYENASILAFLTIDEVSSDLLTQLIDKTVPQPNVKTIYYIFFIC